MGAGERIAPHEAAGRTSPAPGRRERPARGSTKRSARALSGASAGAGRAERMNPWKQRLAETTNKTDARGSLAEVIRGRNLFIGVSRPKVVSKEMIASMAADPIVFALANPVSEISVEDAFEAGAAIALDGRSMNSPGLSRYLSRGAGCARQAHHARDEGRRRRGPRRRRDRSTVAGHARCVGPQPGRRRGRPSVER